MVQRVESTCYVDLNGIGTWACLTTLAARLEVILLNNTIDLGLAEPGVTVDVVKALYDLKSLYEIVLDTACLKAY